MSNYCFVVNKIYLHVYRRRHILLSETCRSTLDVICGRPRCINLCTLPPCRVVSALSWSLMEGVKIHCAIYNTPPVAAAIGRLQWAVDVFWLLLSARPRVSPRVIDDVSSPTPFSPPSTSNAVAILHPIYASKLLIFCDLQQASSGVLLFIVNVIVWNK